MSLSKNTINIEKRIYEKIRAVVNRSKQEKEIRTAEQRVPKGKERK